MHSVPLNHTPGNGEAVNFMSRVLHHRTNSLSYFKYFYLFSFIWGAVLGLHGCVCIATSRGYSPAAVFRLPLAALGLEHPALLAHGLHDLTARGILLDQGSNPCPLHWQADSEPLDHQGSP